MNNLMSHRLPSAQNGFRHSGGGNGFVFVIHIVDVRNICDVRDVGHVSNIRDVDHAQVVAAVVIPRKERFSRSQRKPSHQIHADTDRKAGPSNECN
jgi:hypothetical protein